jgi:S-DNA-T family DNA segregation ATPase FtsK/SpoIIIE
LVLVPRKDRQFPSQPTDLPEIDKDSYLPIYVGQELDGTDHISSIQSWPHALIAGTTGSGKTSFLRGVISQVAGDTRFPSHLIVVDGKGESDYRGLAKDQNYHPNWVGPQLSIDTTIEILEWLVELEIPRRRKILNELADARNGRVDAKDEYLRLVHEGLLCDFSPIVLVIDEFAELMLRGGKSMNSFADHVSSVSQTGRSTLVHMLLATQRPDRKILPGRIHANLDTKIALRVPTPADSMTVLGHGGAEKLLGRGDMLFSWKGTGDKRIQGYFYP